MTKCPNNLSRTSHNASLNQFIHSQSLNKRVANEVSRLKIYFLLTSAFNENWYIYFKNPLNKTDLCRILKPKNFGVLERNSTYTLEKILFYFLFF
jgi:hypothetical protein